MTECRPNDEGIEDFRYLLACFGASAMDYGRWGREFDHTAMEVYRTLLVKLFVRLSKPQPTVDFPEGACLGVQVRDV